MNAIDTEIAWHYAQIALLKAKRNSIAPIRSLPNELLSRIITIYTIDSACRSSISAEGEDFLASAVNLNSLGLPLTLKMSFCHSSTSIRAILDNSDRAYALDIAKWLDTFTISFSVSPSTEH
ncbi:hypothetical protein DFH09DRAFT_1307757 [Mycena vulgaris]|nr:hypothetical protein DFH09DRAFT_1307757 [Mycena vulgaris]